MWPSIRKSFFLALPVLLALTCAKPRPANIILISIDTLRADHVDATRTPHIAALMRESVVYRNAWSHCPLTLPSHLTIFTGELPPGHGVRDNAGYPFDPAKHPTLASVLRGRGYRTGAAVSAYVLRASTGASAGFDSYDDAIGIVDGAPVGALQRPGRVTERIAEQWIASAVKQDQPFFYFLHLYEPHAPYAPTYDADVRDADAIVGDFLASLKREGVYDDALIVLLSDHGEGLGDHGEKEHGIFLYTEALRVPLVVKRPRGRGVQTIGAAVGLDDVKSIILDQGEPKAERPLYAESLYPRIHFGWSELRSIVAGDRQYIEAAHPEAYDLRRDPGERRNLIDEDRRGYASALRDIRAVGGSYAPPEAVSAEEKGKLAALGYISAGGGEETLADPKEKIGDLEALRQAMEHRSIPELERLLAASPRWSDVRDLLGVAYGKVGQHERAAKLYMDGIALSPRLAPEWSLSAASALLDARHFDEAAKHARFAAEHGAPGAHLVLGEIELARGDLAAAASEEALAEGTSAEKAHALFLAARIAAARRDFPRGLELLAASDQERRRTGASLPQNFHYVAADMLARVGRVPEALREFEAEIAINPDNRRAYDDLSLLQTILGDREGAARTRERWNKRGGLRPGEPAAVAAPDKAR